MAIGVVDLFEVIDVDHEHGNGSSGADTIGHVPPGLGEKESAVGQTGQFVRGRHVLEFALIVIDHEHIDHDDQQRDSYSDNQVAHERFPEFLQVFSFCVFHNQKPVKLGDIAGKDENMPVLIIVLQGHCRYRVGKEGLGNITDPLLVADIHFFDQSLVGMDLDEALPVHQVNFFVIAFLVRM